LCFINPANLEHRLEVRFFNFRNSVGPEQTLVGERFLSTKPKLRQDWSSAGFRGLPGDNSNTTIRDMVLPQCEAHSPRSGPWESWCHLSLLRNAHPLLAGGSPKGDGRGKECSLNRRQRITATTVANSVAGICLDALGWACHATFSRCEMQQLTVATSRPAKLMDKKGKELPKAVN